ncbi:hypothetical protein [Hymenobacter sp. BT491]|uniref:hypothetical protein n=1 Tax=Hymenobacter sp. BT491 TaxID=2766779 RepID=UPI00165347AE|nr:hypothetical protein [Hymenobacter sp. BT491]MBC6989840.1 hypothetical protein [Hymenobacter sp. BT491]
MKNVLLALALFAFVGTASAHGDKDGKKGKKESCAMKGTDACCMKKGTKTAAVKAKAATTETAAAKSL